MISLRSMRVGLLTRMMGIVGIIAGVLFIIPLTPLPVVQSLWLVFFGAMLLGFGGRPLPEAWTAGEARPWPPRQPPRPRASRAARPRRAPRSRPAAARARAGGPARTVAVGLQEAQAPPLSGRRVGRHASING